MGNRRSLFGRGDEVHGVAGEAFPVGFPGVDGGLFRAFPAEDRHELMLGGAVLGGDRRACFAQSVGGALAQAGLVAAIPEPVAGAGPLSLMWLEPGANNVQALAVGGGAWSFRAEMGQLS